MTDRPPTCAQGHAITWHTSTSGWCECHAWEFGVYGLQWTDGTLIKSILAALRQARADLADCQTLKQYDQDQREEWREKARDLEEELAVEKQKAYEQINTLCANIDKLRADLTICQTERDYHKDWHDHWYEIAKQQRAEIDRMTQGNSLVIVGSSGPPMVPLDLQVCVVCGKEAKGAQNVGQMIGTSERWEWRCEAHQLIALTVETVRGYADQVAEAKRDLAAEVPHG